MSEQNNVSYPMISAKNWWTIREKFKLSLPTLFSPNYVKTLLTLSDDNSANSNVIKPMKRIGLIDDENKPTELANDWRLDNKYKEVCDTIIKNVYPTELLDLFPDSNVNKDLARDWFMSQSVGLATANKMVALFMLLKQGEIKVNKVKSTKKITTSTKRTKKLMSTNDSNPENNQHEKENNLTNSSNNNGPNLHIDLQIHISPDSTPEQIEAIFESMEKHLYGVKN